MGVLYSPTLLDHYRRPRNHGELASPDAIHEANNPLCGDRIRVMLRVADGIVVEARFKGDACAICTASASLLTERIRGQSLQQVADIGESEVVAALDADIPEHRRQCALLPLLAVRGAVARWSEKTT